MQVGCAGLAFQRYKAGSDTAFTEGLGDEDTAAPPDGQYQNYPAEQGGGGYTEPPFSQPGQGMDNASFTRYWVTSSKMLNQT